MPGISTNQEQKIKKLLAKGNKIAAIKLYGEITGAGLKEAKDEVEAIMRGGPVNIPASAQIGESDSNVDNQIKHLLAARKKIEAVKVYREAHNCGLKEAKDAVDAIELQMRTDGNSSFSSEHPISDDPFAEDTQRNRSCLVLVLSLLVVVVVGLAFFYLIGNGF